MAKSYDVGSLPYTLKSGEANPWQCAFTYQDIEYVEELLDEGRVNEVFVNQTRIGSTKFENEICTPLSLACKKWPEIVEHLLIKNAEVNQHIDDFGNKALKTALEWNNDQVVGILLKYNVDVKLSDLEVKHIRKIFFSSNSPNINSLQKKIIAENHYLVKMFKTLRSITSANEDTKLNLHICNIMVSKIKDFKYIDHDVSVDLFNSAIQVLHFSSILNPKTAAPFTLGKELKELSAEILISLACKPNITDKIIEAVNNSSIKLLNNSNPYIGKIPGAFTESFFREHPLWSVKKCLPISKLLSPKAKVASDLNADNSRKLKDGINDVINEYLFKNLTDIVIGYAYNPEIDFAADYHFSLAGQSAIEVPGDVMHLSGAASVAAAHEG